MGEFVSAAKTSDIPPGQGKTVDLGDKKIAVFNVEGTFYAIEDTCIHRGGPLGQGELEGHMVTCPWHGWKYDVRTGEMTLNAAARVSCYPTRIEGGDVEVCC
ncbi:MAG: non-heme iron oxygenase ferredoxin subunit [Acidobacteria bacterium]|nr:non-heme iron oxygenase ferredoxin subunit [Acidobacteriota bacterium]